MRRALPLALVALAGCGAASTHPTARTYTSRPRLQRSFPLTDVLVGSADFPKLAGRWCHLARGTTRDQLVRIFRGTAPLYLVGDRAPSRVETWRLSVVKTGVEYHTTVLPPNVALEATFDANWHVTRLRWGRKPSAPHFPCGPDRRLG